jgi:hypothetical protein
MDITGHILKARGLLVMISQTLLPRATNLLVILGVKLRDVRGFSICICSTFVSAYPLYIIKITH